MSGGLGGGKKKVTGVGREEEDKGVRGRRLTTAPLHPGLFQAGTMKASILLRSLCEMGSRTSFVTRMATTMSGAAMTVNTMGTATLKLLTVVTV